MGIAAASPRKRALSPAVIHAGFRLLPDGAEGRFWVVGGDIIELAERREAYADAVRPPNRADGFDHFHQQPRPTVERPAIGVHAMIGARIDELVDEITIGAVNGRVEI